jgi:ABC-type Zn uptake system ZnuABC Zn-binding protein ZnuA
MVGAPYKQNTLPKEGIISMENLKEKYLELMGKKLEAMDYMLTVTKDNVFTGEQEAAEKEAEAFIALYEKRSNVMSRIEKIEDALELLDPLDSHDMEDKEFQAEVVNFREKMKAVAKEIVEMDKANTTAYEKISTYFKDTMKQARQSIDLISGYDDYYDKNEGHFVDKKKL